MVDVLCILFELYAKYFSHQFSVAKMTPFMAGRLAKLQEYLNISHWLFTYKQQKELLYFYSVV